MRRLWLAFLLLFSLPLIAQITNPAPARRFIEVTVANLPAATAANSGQVWVATDSIVPGSCITGGGTGKTLCRSNGSSYDTVGVPNGPTFTLKTTFATPSASVSASGNMPSGSGNTAVAGDWWRDANGFNFLDSTSVNGGIRLWDQASHNRLDDTTGTITAFTVHHPAAAPTTASVEATDTCGSAICAESWIHAARVCFLIADHTGSSSATLGNITWSSSCTFPVAASTVYTVSCDVQSTSTNAAGGLFMGWTGPGTPTASNYTLFQSTSATASGSHNISTTTTYSTSGAGVVAQTITTVWPAHFAGTFENGTNAGTLSIQFANGSATGSTVLKRGSFCTVT